MAPYNIPEASSLVQQHCENIMLRKYIFLFVPLKRWCCYNPVVLYFGDAHFESELI